MNKWLVGNGRPCPDCEGTGFVHAGDVIEYVSGHEERLLRKCYACDGEARIPIPAEEILRGSIKRELIDQAFPSR